MTVRGSGSRSDAGHEHATAALPEYDICGFALHEMERLAAGGPASGIPDGVKPVENPDAAPRATGHEGE